MEQPKVRSCMRRHEPVGRAAASRVIRRDRRVGVVGCELGWGTTPSELEPTEQTVSTLPPERHHIDPE